MILRAILTALMLIIMLAPVSARKHTLRLKGDKKEQQQTTAHGSFMVASQCLDCNRGYRLDQIAFSGFDKPGSSSNESFFITNNTDRTMSAIALYVEYLTPDGRQLHKRYLRLDCNIPAGETRRAEIKSFDTQRSFNYIDSPSTRHSVPFTVVFDPVAFYLRF